MKKIAIFTSWPAPAALRVANLFNEGNCVRVSLVLSDHGMLGMTENFRAAGVDVVSLPVEKWHYAADEILSLLAAQGIDLIALDNFNGIIPEGVTAAYAGRIVQLTDEDAAPREIVSALGRYEDRRGGLPGIETVSPETPDVVVAEDCPGDGDVVERVQEIPPMPQEAVAKSADEEWAEALQVRFDAGRLPSTPPPVPIEAVLEEEKAYAQRPAGGDAYAQRPAGGDAYGERPPMPSTWLLGAILTAVFCCTLPGIVAVIFSWQVSSRYQNGDYEGARRASRNTEIWIIVSFVLGVISATLYLPVMLLG